MKQLPCIKQIALSLVYPGAWAKIETVIEKHVS